MESECSRCHRKFQSSTEEMTVCPACLREEFAVAPKSNAGKEREAIKHENEISFRRAAARAERLSGGLQTGSSLTPHGTLRFVLGIVIFLICTAIFMLGSFLEDWQLRTYLPVNAQRPLSILLCWAAAALVFSSRRNKLITYPLVLFFAVSGLFMPTFWAGMSAQARRGAAIAIAASRGDEAGAGAEADKAPAVVIRALTEEDLAIYREKRQTEGDVVNYGIYIDVREISMRQKVRDALIRLLEAEICVPYTRGKGTLFVVARAVGGMRNITPLMKRFGELTYSSHPEGIYEVAFSPEKVCAARAFPSEVLSSPEHPSFVEANLLELRNLLEPRRVRMAAHLLASANVQEKSEEIRQALTEVLRDPWASEPGTYQTLVEALAVYAAPGDKDAVDMCRKYFLNSRLAHRPPSPAVMELLIREVPNEMVAPVVELWRSNPVEWGSVLAQLGTMSQEYLLEMLAETESNQLKSYIIKHLEVHGTPEAAPAIRPYLDHPDPSVSRAARATLDALEVHMR